VSALALVFPGQGSQVPGMASAWADSPGASRWTEASEVLGRDVARLGTEAGEDELREPRACQVALFVHHLVLLEAWRGAGGDPPRAVAGHSLGEYDALVAAGALTFPDALRLVDLRARVTQEAADAQPGTMLACLGFPDGLVASAAAEVGAFVANDNAPGQVVVAGSAEALQTLRERLPPDEGRVRDVKVGAAYHSPHMEPAVEPLAVALSATRFDDTAVPVVANVDAAPHSSGADWPELLRRQVTAPVRWRETVGALAALGVTEVVELCASPVLTGLVKRTDRELARRTVSSPEDLS